MFKLGLAPNTSEFEKLVAAYAESCRAYHTDEHIQACLSHLDRVEGQALRPEEIELALWFHDAVYKPLSSSNEEDSAQWASKFLSRSGAPVD